MRVRSRHSRRTVPITRSSMALAPRCPDRARDDPCALCGEDGVEASGEPGVAIADEEACSVRLVGGARRETTDLSGNAIGDRVGGHAGDPHETRVVVDEHEDVEPAEEDHVDMDELAGHQSLRLCGKELRPSRSRSPRRRPTPVRGRCGSASRGGPVVWSKEARSGSAGLRHRRCSNVGGCP